VPHESVPVGEDERDNVWIGDGVLGFDIKAGQVRVLAHEPFQLLGADCNEKHFPCAGPSDRLLFETLAEQGKSAGQ